MKQKIASILIYSIIISFTHSSLVFAQNRTDARWTNLFNGKDLKGWTQRGGKALYKVENGEMEFQDWMKKWYPRLHNNLDDFKGLTITNYQNKNQ